MASALIVWEVEVACSFEDMNLVEIYGREVAVKWPDASVFSSKWR